MLSAESDLEVAEHEDVEVVAAIVVRIALHAPAVRRGDHRPKDVDHGAVSAISGRSWSA